MTIKERFERWVRAYIRRVHGRGKFNKETDCLRCKIFGLENVDEAERSEVVDSWNKFCKGFACWLYVAGLEEASEDRYWTQYEQECLTYYQLLKIFGSIRREKAWRKKTGK